MYVAFESFRFWRAKLWALLLQEVVTAAWLAELLSVGLFPADRSHSQLLIPTDFMYYGGCFAFPEPVRIALLAGVLQWQGGCFPKHRVSAETWFPCLAVGVSYLRSLES